MDIVTNERPPTQHHASPLAWRAVSVVALADRLYQLERRSSRVSISDLSPAERRPYEQAAVAALNVLRALLEHETSTGVPA